MTEAEWFACTEPWRMVDYLRSNRRLRNARKLRLFVVASCRRHWALLTDERSREAVEVAELYADGLATDRQREVAARAARAAQRTVFRPAFKASCAAAAYPGYAAYYGANRSAAGFIICRARLSSRSCTKRVSWTSSAARASPGRRTSFAVTNRCDAKEAVEHSKSRRLDAGGARHSFRKLPARRA